MSRASAPTSSPSVTFQAAEDSALRTLLGSLGGVLLLFALAYRSIRLPMLIGITLFPATAAALGLAALALGGIAQHDRVCLCGDPDRAGRGFHHPLVQWLQS